METIQRIQVIKTIEISKTCRIQQCKKFSKSIKSYLGIKQKDTITKVLLKLDILTAALIKLNRQPIKENKLSEVTNEYSKIVPLHLIHSYK